MARQRTLCNDFSWGSLYHSDAWTRKSHKFGAQRCLRFPLDARCRTQLAILMSSPGSEPTNVAALLLVQAGKMDILCELPLEKPEIATGCVLGLQPRFWWSMGRTPSKHVLDIDITIYWYGESAKGLRFVASVHCHRSARATCWLIRWWPCSNYSAPFSAHRRCKAFFLGCLHVLGHVCSLIRAVDSVDIEFYHFI